MKYFKTNKNEVYVYDDNADEKFYKEGLIPITEKEANEILNPLPDIEDARKQKHTEINHWRDIQENGSVTFTWNNHSWDASKASQDRLAPVLVVAKSGQLPEGFFWTDANNEDVPVTVDDLTAIDAGMTQAMVNMGWKIHERQREMKKEVDELKRASDILNYPVGWTDDNGN
ncbi:DUF4376 domain-containing protein [Salmonella enterica]|nr:DUF4376 domain-containing protein [Salmonella enterica]